MAENRRAALAAREAISVSLGIPLPCPDSMVGAMAAILLPGPVEAPNPKARFDPLQDALFHRFGVEIPVFPWPARQQRWMNVQERPL